MNYYFSPKTKGFYLSEFMEQYEESNTKPDKLTEISSDLYNKLIDGQSKGLVISVDDKGGPVLIKPASLAE
jgi:hypothetical protein